jgi:hypothetical protein
VVLWASIKGLAVLLFSGALLALLAVFMPRLLKWWERREAARLGLEETVPVPGLPGRERAPSPSPAPSGPAALGPHQPHLAPAGAAADEPLVAAAIGLALTLYQEEQRETLVLPRSEASSPWAQAGRWQAMQARLNLPKR